MRRPLLGQPPAFTLFALWLDVLEQAQRRVLRDLEAQP